MTFEEAIEALEVLRILDAPGLSEAVHMAISALRAQQETEKNEPLKHGHIVWKERTTGGYKYMDAKCHICGSTVTVEVSRPMEHDKVPYCSKCGKRLDDRFRNYCSYCGVSIDSEKAEKGCKFCRDGEIIALDMCNDAVTIETDGRIHVMGGGDWECEINYCPMCGRQLRHPLKEH